MGGNPAMVLAALLLTACAADGTAPRRQVEVGARQTENDTASTASNSPKPANVRSSDLVAAGRALEAGNTTRARDLLGDEATLDGEGLFLAGRVAAALGEHEKAARLFQSATVPPEAEPLRQVGLARALANAGSRGEAIALAGTLLKSGLDMVPEERWRIAADRASWLAAAGDPAAPDAWAEAARLATGAVERDRLLLEQGRALLAAGRTAEARDMLRPLAQNAATGRIMIGAEKALAEAGMALAWTDSERLKRAERLLEVRAFDGARAALEPLLSGRGRLAAEARWLEARILYQRRRRYAEAEKALAAVAAGHGPHADEAAFLRARALSRLNRDDEAARAFRDHARKTRNRARAAEAGFLAARLDLFHGRNAVALAALEKIVGKDKNGKSALAPDDAREARFLAGLAALLDGRPGRAVSHFEASTEGVKSAEILARGRYWIAVARTQRGDGDGPDLLRAECRPDPTGWYASHVRARLIDLGQDLGPCRLDPLPARPVAPAPPDIRTLSPLAAFLARIGLFSEAGSALRRAESRGGVKARPADWIAAYLAVDAPHHAIARAEAGLGWPPSDLGRARAAYPTPYLELVREVEARHSLPRDLVYAIARKESLFNPRAVSGSGALGLMQIMPFVYERLARLEGLPPLEEDGLPSAEDSIRAAGRELALLLERFGGSLPLAIMAYNGGAEAVSGWLSRSGGEPLDVFVEKAGFDQTRVYVKRVWQNLVRYRLIDGEQPPDLPRRAERPVAPATGTGVDGAPDAGVIDPSP